MMFCTTLENQNHVDTAVTVSKALGPPVPASSGLGPRHLMNFLKTVLPSATAKNYLISCQTVPKVGHQITFYLPYF